MAFEYIGMVLENNLQTQVRSQERRILRQMEDPFDLSNNEFQMLFRLNKNEMENIIDCIQQRLECKRITGISPEKQILSAIRFYATGCFQRPVGEQWGISLSQTSVSRSLHKVTDALNDIMLKQWVKFPATPYERNCLKNEFRNSSYPFEGCIGAIDCSHVAILAPSNNEGAYVNHHGYHSLNVQMICDPNLKILNVNAQYAGSRHDAYIWGSSPVRIVMERAFNNGERKTFLIGDMGYPLEPWLMTPLPEEIPGTPRFAYNEALCKTRNCIERAFGVIKSSWRCLSRHRTLQYNPTFAGKIINACTILNNIKRRCIENIPYQYTPPQNSSQETIVESQPLLSVARRIQNQIIEQNFC